MSVELSNCEIDQTAAEFIKVPRRNEALCAERKIKKKSCLLWNEAARQLKRASSVGADDFVSTVRELGVTPHVARRQHGAIDERTSRHPGYAISLSKRWRVERPFGWLKQIGLLKKVELRGLAKVDWLFVFTARPTT